jgi:hypothetical protein
MGATSAAVPHPAADGVTENGASHDPALVVE